MLFRNSFLRFWAQLYYIFVCFVLCLILACCISLVFLFCLQLGSCLLHLCHIQISNGDWWSCFLVSCLNVLFSSIKLYREEFIFSLVLLWILCFFTTRNFHSFLCSEGKFINNLFLFIILLLLSVQPFLYFCSLFIEPSSTYLIDAFWSNDKPLLTLHMLVDISFILYNSTLVLNYLYFIIKYILVFSFGFILLLFNIEAVSRITFRRLLDFNWFVLFICLLLFSLFFILSAEFLLLFINFIGINLITYTLLVLENNTRGVVEGTLKYFFLSTVSSLFFIGGVLLLFSMWKTTNLVDFHLILQSNLTHQLLDSLRYNVLFNTSTEILSGYVLVFNSFEDNCLFYAGMFLLFSFIFKLSLFPLHSWAAEVYSIISPKLLFIFIIMLKVIFFVKFVHIFVYTLCFLPITFGVYFNLILCFIAGGSVAISTLSAVFEDKIRRLLAFSSTNQLGFVFSGFIYAASSMSVFPENFFSIHFSGIRISFLFMLVYILCMIAFLFILGLLLSYKPKLKYISDLIYVDFFWVACLFILLLSLSGIPPFAGFFIKFYIISYLWSLNYVFFSVFIVFMSVLGCYYYLRILKILSFETEALWLLNKKLSFLLTFIKSFRHCFGSISFLWFFETLIKFYVWLLVFFVIVFVFFISYVIFYVDLFTYIALYSII